MAAHPPTLPTDCPSCRAVLSARVELAVTMPGGRLTNSAVVARSGLKLRAVQLHTAHLRAHGLVDETGAPTDQPLSYPAGPDATPLQWASAVDLDCATCRCILCALARHARGDWTGQHPIADLAAELGLSEWTVRAHLRTGHSGKVGHSLTAAGLVAWRPDGSITGRDKHGQARYVRRPDRFILAPERVRPETRPGGDTYATDALAERLRTETVWFDPTHPQAVWVVRLMASLIADGWPESLLMEKLRERPHRMPLRAPYRYARARLPKRGTPYVRSGRAPHPEQVAPRCIHAKCRVRMPAPTFDGLCGECREDAAAGFTIQPVSAPPEYAATAYALAGPPAPAF